MKTLRLSESGVRGYYGDSLTPQIVVDLASAFGSLLDGGQVLVARDTRLSSPTLDRVAKASLLATGCDVFDFGVCPTPILQQAVPREQARGALVVTAGHTGMGWNAVTLIDHHGAILDAIRGEAVLDFFHAGDFAYANWESLGTLNPVGEFFPQYLHALEGTVDADAIRRAKFTILADCAGGAGTMFLPEVADRFGVRLIHINGEPTGFLPREAEPRPRSARQVASIMEHAQGNAGFVFSSDMGRLSLVTEKGYRASEEFTFPVIAAHLLQKQAGTVVTNGCSSRMIDDICSANQARLVKARVGQSYINAALADEGGIFGGEGNGSFCLPRFSMGFDGFLMMALVLEAMATTGAPLSRHLENMPEYHIIKKNRPCDAHAAYHAVDRVKRILANSTEGTIDSTDGLRIDWENAWAHIRPSHTEQLIRIFSEATTRKEAESRSEAIVRILEKVL